MAQAPWYLSQGGAPTLAHQRKEEAARSGFETFYRRGEFTGQAAAFRAGACRNCGSATHKERDCVERPRAVGAWKSGRDIAPDEAMPSGHASDWDAKRDRWAGYQVEQHDETIERYNAVEVRGWAVRGGERGRGHSAAELGTQATILPPAPPRTRRRSASACARRPRPRSLRMPWRPRRRGKWRAWSAGHWPLLQPPRALRERQRRRLQRERAARRRLQRERAAWLPPPRAARATMTTLPPPRRQAQAATRAAATATQTRTTRATAAEAGACGPEQCVCVGMGARLLRRPL